MRPMLTMVLLSLFLASCAYTSIDHPGFHEHDALDQTALGVATERAVDDLPISIPKLHGEPVYVEVVGSNPGRLRAHVIEALRSYRLTLVDRQADAKFTLRISERMAGVNGLTEVYWYTVGFWTWYASAQTAQATCTLNVELIDEKGQIVETGSSGPKQVLVDLERNKTLWLLFLPLSLQRYVADGTDYEVAIPLSHGLPVFLNRPLF